MNSIVDQLLGNIGTTSTAPVQASPVTAPTATEKDYANAATSLLAAKSSYGSASATDAEKDLREMNPVQLTDKYGKEGAVAMLSALAAESQNRITNSAAPRSGFESIGDTGLGVGIGAVNLAGGVGAFLGSTINDDLGLGVAKATQSIADFGRGLQSDELNQVRQDESQLMALAARDNKQAYDEQVANGGNEFIAGAKRIGSDLFDQGSITLDSGAATTDLVAEGLGSMLPVAKVSQGLSGLAQLGRQALVKAGLKDTLVVADDIAAGATRMNALGKQVPLTLADVGTSKGALGALDKLGNFAKVPAVIGAAEGGSAIAETYDKAIAAGGTHEQALDAAMYARNMQAAIGAATGTLVKNFEGNLGAKVSAGQATGNLLREGVEEGIQEGTAASSANLGVDSQGLGDGDILSGVGSGAFKGIAGGMGSAALISFPTLAARTAQLAGKGVAATATGLVNYASEKIAAKETKEAEAAQTVAVQALTSPEAKVEFADKIQTLSQQVVADAVARNAAPEEIAEIEADNAALSSYAAELQDALAWEVPPAGILPPTVDAALVGTTTVVEAINALAKFSKDTNNVGADRLVALENAVSFMEGINSVLEQDSSIASKHEQYAGLSEYVNAYENVFRSVIESADGIDGMQERFQALYDAGKNDIVMYSREAPPTPEAVNNTLTLASRIGTTDPKLDSAVQFVLEDLESGILELQPAQATKLKGIVAIREAARVRADAMKAYGLPAVAKVTSEISLDDGSGKNGKVSLNRYANDVTTAMQSGNVESASKILENLRTFAQSMNNKAQAFSDHIDGKNLTTTKVNIDGVEQDSSTVYYQTRVANGSNTFRRSTKGVYVQFNNDSAVATAKTVYADAAGVTTAYNQLLEAFPELAATAQPQTIVPIHPKLAARKVGTAEQNTAPAPVATSAPVVPTTPVAAPTEPQNTEEAFANPNTTPEKAAKIKGYTARLQEFVSKGSTLESSATNLFNLIKDDPAAVAQMKGYLKNKQKALASGELKKPLPLLAHLEKLLGESTETTTATTTAPETTPVTPAPTETVAPTTVATPAPVTVADKTFEVAESEVAPTPTPTVADETPFDVAPTVPTATTSPEPSKPTVSSVGSNTEATATPDGKTAASTNKGTTSEVTQKDKANPLTLEPSKETTEVPTETVEESSEKSLQESFPDLLGGENNAFYQGFSFPATERSKLTSEPKPYTAILTYLAGKDSVLGSLLGDTKVAEVKIKAANAYRQIISTYFAGNFFNTLNKQLEDFTKQVAIKPTSKDVTVAKDIVNNADNFFKGDLAEVQKFIDSVTADSKITKATGRAAELIAEHRVTVANSTTNTKLADTLRRNGQLFATGKALNITFLDENGQPQYNNALMSTAIVAATQWLVSEGRRANGKVYTAEDASDVFSLPEEYISFGLLRQMQGKITTQMLVSSLRDHILKYWGLAANKNAPEGYSTGVAQGVAQEIIRALLGDTKQKTGAVLQRIDVVIEADADKGIPARTVNFYKFNLPTTSDAFVFPSLIDDAVLTDNTTQEFFYKPEDVPVRMTQMHSNSVTLTDEQIDTIKQHNSIAYKVDSPVVAVLNAIKLDGLQFIFGAGKINEATTNDTDLISVEGINKDLSLAFTEMNNTIARMDSVGSDSVYYAHEVSSVSRVQQRGVSVPQSNKLMRIALTATKATVDLTDTTSTVYQTFTIALAQAFGVKVHNEPSITTISAKLDKMLQHEDVVKVLPLLASGSEAFSVEEIKAIKAALKATDTTMVALQALTDYARFTQATPEQRKSFETALYIEADGVTNGIANTFMIMNIKAVTASDLRNWGRVGLYLNQPGKTLNDFKQGGLLGDAVDVYTNIVDKMVEYRMELLQQFKDENKQRSIQAFSHITVLLGLFGEGASMDSAGNVTFARNATKQPSTAINYGSGAKAVSVQMMDGILSNMYAAMTTALKAKAKAQGNGQSITLAEAMFGKDNGAEVKLKALLDAYNFLTNHHAQYNKASRSYDIVPNKFQTERRNQNLRSNMSDAELKKFLMAPYHIQTITKMLQITHADTVYAAAKGVLGFGTVDGMDTLMQSTNLHTTLLEEIFKQKVKDALAARKADESSNYNSADFLSKKELAAIEKEMRPLVPVYSSATQRMRVAKTTTNEVATNSLSTALNNTLSVPVEFEGISNAGVSGLAKFLLSMGDAQMIQSFVNDPELEGMSYLTVFDGIHGGLDVFNDVSVAANKAAFGAWVKNNPLQVVSKGFSKMGKALTEDMLDELSPSARIKIALLMDKEFDALTDISSAELMELLQRYDYNLYTKALIVRAKQNVLAKTKSSVHQMAAGFTPYQHEGSIEVTGSTFEEQAHEFNLLVQKEFIRLGGKAENYPVSPPSDILTVTGNPEIVEEAPTSPATEKGMSQEEYETFTAEVAGFRGSEGVTVEDDVTIVKGAGGLYGLLRRLDSHYSTNQVRVLKALMDSMANSGVTVIFGTKATIAAKILKDRGHESNSARGTFYPDTNTLYISVATTQTLVHELIHASTASILFTHYGQGSKAKSSPVKSAVAAIEKMRDDFMNPATRALLVSKFPQTNAENQGVLARYDQVVKVIQYGLDQANSSKDPAERVRGKVIATNEFMAHALANFSLGSKVLPNLPSKFSAWVKGVKEAIMKLLGISPEQMPKSGGGIDMFTNLLFNTQILAKAQEGSSNSGIDIGSMDDADFGNDPRLTDLHNKIDQLILVQSDETKGVLSGLEPVTISDTGNAAIANFQMNAQEATVFNKMLAVLQADIALNSSAYTQAQAVYAHAMKNLKVTDFEEDSSLESEVIAQYRMAYLLSKQQGDVADKFSVFLALAATSEPMRKALSKVPPMPSTKSTKVGMDGVLENFGNKALANISKLMGETNSVTGSTQQVLDKLLVDLFRVNKAASSFVTKVLEPAEAKLSAANEYTSEKIADVASSGAMKSIAALRNKASEKNVQRLLGNLATVVSDEDLRARVSEGMSRGLESLELPKPIQALVNDLVGRTESNKSIVDLIKPIKAFIARTRQSHINDDPITIQNAFSRKLKNHEWEALNSGIAKADLAVFTSAQVASFLGGKTSIATEIGKLEAIVNNAKMLSKAKQLANYMMTGVAGNGLQRNAHAIANNLGSNSPVNASEDLVKTVDKLVSLYAFKSLSESTQTTLRDLAKTEKNGLEFLTAYMKGLRAEDQLKLANTPTGKNNYYKGAMASTATADGSLIVRSVRERAALQKLGYVSVGKYLGDSRDTQARNMSYFYMPITVNPRFRQGLFQNIQITAGGINLATGHSVGSRTVGLVTKGVDIDKLIGSKQLGVVNSNEFLLPLFDAEGRTIGFERSVDPKQLARFKYSTRIDQLAGKHRGRQVEERDAHQFNRGVITKLHEAYTADAAKSKRIIDREYVDLFDEKYVAKDPVLKNAMERLSHWSRADIENTFGEKFLVRRSLVEDVLGYQSASVTDPFTGVSRWSPQTLKVAQHFAESILGTGAMKKLLIAENTVQSTVGTIKTNIVVRSVVVPLVNIMSNVVHLLAVGVPIADIAGGTTRKIKEAEFYAKSSKRLNVISAEKLVAKYRKDNNKVLSLTAEENSIKQSINRLSIADLISAGEFNSITDQDSRVEATSNAADYSIKTLIEKSLDNTSGIAREVIRYGLITEDTALFKNLQKAVFYGDFIAKSLMYDNLRKNGVSKAEALGRISEEFVNYDRNAGRAREALEDSGLLWFYNYKLRSVKIAARLIRDNPLNALLSAVLVPSTVGGVVSDNAITKVLEGSIYGSMGIDTGLRGAFMNPWMNLLD